MKLKIQILIVFVSVCSLLISNTWEVKQDGSGDFTTIQEGIIASSVADTVLVYPGTYYENIDYLEKSITVASLYIITPEDSLINQTIIDGNHNFRCVTIDECENTQLIGFTIQNGLATQENVYESYQGGGIFIKEISNTLIANCIIKNNKSINGGGIWIYSGNITLRGNTIKNNRSIQTGGGLNIIGDTDVQFDEIDLNNIFLNYSSTGTDVFISEYLPNIVDVIVDTFSVNEHDYFFVAAKYDTYTFSNLSYKIEQIDQDLFVAPDGNDENDGLTAENPLQTIAWAQTIIKRNDENPHTIHLASGIYSPSMNNQKFPFGVKHGIKYIGTSAEETILDGDNQCNVLEYHFYPDVELPKIYLENIKIINDLHDSYGAIFTLKANLELNNVIISDCYGDVGSAIKCRDGIYDFNNVEIINNSGGEAIRISCIYANNPNPVLDIKMENVLIQENYPGQGEMAGSGGGSNFRGHSEIVGDFNARILNCNFNGNYSNFYNPQTGLGGSSGMLIDYMQVDVINCTFGNNILSQFTGCIITVDNSEVNLFNSILYDNDGFSLNILDATDFDISHSLIEGGDESINYYGNGYVNWLIGNLIEDPLWLGNGVFPYYLQCNSPCIDAGTLDLPPGVVLPEFDLAGNPRVVNGMIDIGAYEYQDSVSVQEEIIKPITQIFNFPNPFNPSTTINLNLAESGKVEMAIYNIKGQKIKTLIDAFTNKGTFELYWNGKDEMGKAISSGQYIVKLQQNGKETAKKIMLLK
jgi:Secretion system C-terminal sorting domain/Right handed beta helix region